MYAENQTKNFGLNTRTMTTKTKIEIINETIEFYSENPKLKRAIVISESRSLNNNFDFGSINYQYKTSEGKACAVGRCLIESAPFTELNKTGFVNLRVLNYLKSDYEGHNLKFWKDLQELHDDGSNWDDSGLTPQGKNTADLLKKYYK